MRLLQIVLCIATAFLAFGADDAQACVSKNPAQCFCKIHPERCVKEEMSDVAKDFEVTATYCANPWNGDEGPNWGAAARVADRDALKQCYPFQTHQVSDYRYENYDGCRHGFHGSQATATYRCASATTTSPVWSGVCGPRASYQCWTHRKFGEICGCRPNR